MNIVGYIMGFDFEIGEEVDLFKGNEFVNGGLVGVWVENVVNLQIYNNCFKIIVVLVVIVGLSYYEVI